MKRIRIDETTLITLFCAAFMAAGVYGLVRLVMYVAESDKENSFCNSDLVTIERVIREWDGDAKAVYVEFDAYGQPIILGRAGMNNCALEARASGPDGVSGTEDDAWARRHPGPDRELFTGDDVLSLRRGDTGTYYPKEWVVPLTVPGVTAQAPKEGP